MLRHLNAGDRARCSRRCRARRSASTTSGRVSVGEIPDGVPWRRAGSPTPTRWISRGTRDATMPAAFALDINAMSSRSRANAHLSATVRLSRRVLLARTRRRAARRPVDARARRARDLRERRRRGRTDAVRPRPRSADAEPDRHARERYPALDRRVVAGAAAARACCSTRRCAGHRRRLHRADRARPRRRRRRRPAPHGRRRRCVDRHANLRTAFVSERRRRPACRWCSTRWTLPWTHVDLSALDRRPTGTAELDALMLREPDRPIRPRRAAPLMRFLLIETATAATGSPSPTTTSCSTAGRCRCSPGSADPVRGGRRRAGAAAGRRPYRDFLSWLAAQDREASVAAWRDGARRRRGADPRRAARRGDGPGGRPGRSSSICRTTSPRG